MKYIYILFIAFFVGACNHVEKYSISGTWEGADGQIVCLLDGWGEDARVVDSAVVRDGKFHMGKEFTGEKRLTLSMGSGTETILLDREPIVVEIVGFLGKSRAGGDETGWRVAIYSYFCRDVRLRDGSERCVIGSIYRF